MPPPPVKEASVIPLLQFRHPHQLKFLPPLCDRHAGGLLKSIRPASLQFFDKGVMSHPRLQSCLKKSSLLHPRNPRKNHMPLLSPHRGRAKSNDWLVAPCCVRCVHNDIFTHLNQFSNNFSQPKKKPAEPIHMRICGLLEGEPTTRFELVTYRLRIKKLVL
jgi:hypothetical protein